MRPAHGGSAGARDLVKAPLSGDSGSSSSTLGPAGGVAPPSSGAEMGQGAVASPGAGCNPKTAGRPALAPPRKEPRRQMQETDSGLGGQGSKGGGGTEATGRRPISLSQALN